MIVRLLELFVVLVDHGAAEMALNPNILPQPGDGGDDADQAGDQVVAPMPGRVRIVHVQAGDEVTRGAPLAVLEAMKMEHTLTAPRDGTIAELRVKEGEQVTENAVIACLTPEDQDD